MKKYIINKLAKYQIYVTTIIQPIENKNSTAWEDYGWDEVAEDKNISNEANIIIFELQLIIQNDTIKPFIKMDYFYNIIFKQLNLK